MIYSDAYLFDVATRMLDEGMNTIDVTDKIVRDCKLDREHVSRIVSIAFDPSTAFGA
jgi:hypothetical protein